MTDQRNKQTSPTDTWDKAEFLWNGTPLLQGKINAMFYDEENTLDIKATSDIADEIYVALVDNEESLKITMIPKFNTWNKLVGGEISFKIRPEDVKNGALKLVIASRQLDIPVEIVFQVMSPNPTELFAIRIDGAVYKPGETAFTVRGSSHLIEVEPLPGSGLTGKNIELSSGAATPPSFSPAFNPPEGSQELNPSANWRFHPNDVTDAGFLIKFYPEGSPLKSIDISVDVGYQDYSVKMTTIIQQTVGNLVTLISRSMTSLQPKTGVKVKWLLPDGSQQIQFTGANAASSIQFKKGDVVGVVTVYNFNEGKPNFPRTFNVS